MQVKSLEARLEAEATTRLESARKFERVTTGLRQELGFANSRSSAERDRLEAVLDDMRGKMQTERDQSQSQLRLLQASNTDLLQRIDVDEEHLELQKRLLRDLRQPLAKVRSGSATRPRQIRRPAA